MIATQHWLLAQLILLLSIMTSSPLARADSSTCVRIIEESFYLTDSDRPITDKDTIQFLPIFRSEVLSLASRYVWIKLELEADHCTEDMILSIPSREISEVVFWQFRGPTLLHQDHYLAFTDLRRYYPLRHSPRFKLDLGRGISSTVYIRLHSNRKFELSYQINSESAAISEELKSQVYFLLFLGLAIGLTLYNLYLYSTTREKVYFYFSAYALAVIIGTTINEGNADLFFPINSSWYYYLNLVVATAIYFKLKCVRSLLPLRIQAPKLDRCIYYCSYSCIAIFVVSLWRPAADFIDGYMALYVAATTALCAYAAAVSYQRDFKPARILVAAWTATFIIVGLRFLTQMGQIESSLLVAHAYKLGLTIELILLAVVLADKINFLQNELQRLNEGLEQKINNRTKQLKKANQKAQENQAYIVEQEKFSALGRIADALAHEVNTPLMIIRTGATILKKNSATIEPEMIERRTEQLERAVDKIEKIIKAITITYLNPLTNKDKTEVDICKYVQSILDLHSGLCIEHEIELTVLMPEQLTIPGNPLHLADILSELINSSIEAAQSAPARWIEVSLRRKKRDIVVILKDSATSESDTLRKEIFSESSDLHPKLLKTSKAKSLAIANHVLKSYGGSLKFVQNTFYTQATVKFPVDLKRRSDSEAA